MAKGIRSKYRRACRTEFRRTIGEKAAQENMSTVQAKLMECIGSGKLNSFDQLASQLSTTSADGSTNTPVSSPMELFPSGSNVVTTEGKREEKIPIKKNNKSKKKKQWIPNAIGQTGSLLARKKIVKLKSKGKWKNGQVVNRPSKNKKRVQK